MSKAKIIKCPKCGSDVIRYDGRRTIPIDGKCKRCNVLVVYYPEEHRIATREVPDRLKEGCPRFY